MQKKEINNHELERLIAMKSGKTSFSEVTEEDLNRIEDITLSAFLINGKRSDIDICDVRFLPNLKNLRISGFDFSQQDLDELVFLERLERLDFSDCKFSDISFEKLNGRLRHISFTGCEKLPFKYPEVEDVVITGSELDFGIFDFLKIKSINIQDSIINNIHGLEEFENIRSVNLDGTQLYGSKQEKLDDIQVSSETSYSHKRERLIIDEELML